MDFRRRERDWRASRSPRLRAAIWLGLLLSCGWSLHAELVVLTNGGVLRVDDYVWHGSEQVTLQLRSGGRLRLSVYRIERILDEAKVPQEEADSAATLTTEGQGMRFEPLFVEGASVPQVSAYGELLYRAGRSYGVNPQLLAAVARAESAFDAAALSRKGARGLMQLMPATAERFGVAAQELWNPERNVEAGARYLRFLIDRYDADIGLVLAAYNAGEGTVRRYGGIPPYRETRRYVERVMTFLKPAAGGELEPELAGL